MKRIWAPWRIEYILGKKPDGCVLCCDMLKQDRDTQDLILFRGAYCYVMMNRYPYNNGHLMVIPYQHTDMPTNLSAETLTEMMELVNISLQVLREAMQPDGFNVGMNLGTSAGAGIKDHIHMHIVPRWTGDTNFMPVLGDTRVIVEALDGVYARIKPLFDAKLGPTDADQRSAREPV